MPCGTYDELDIPENREALIKKVNQLTDMLCRTGRNYFIKQGPPEDVIEWMKKHCEYDKERGEPWDIENTKEAIECHLEGPTKDE